MNMTLKDLINLQREFDISHQFKTTADNDKEKFLLITKEIVGLVGEIGEFSNIIKKINLKTDSNLPISDLTLIEDNLKEELIDSFIYLIRLATILDIDIEKEYLNKRQKNFQKYKNHLNE